MRCKIVFLVSAEEIVEVNLMLITQLRRAALTVTAKITDVEESREKRHRNQKEGNPCSLVGAGADSYSDDSARGLRSGMESSGKSMVLQLQAGFWLRKRKQLAVSAAPKLVGGIVAEAEAKAGRRKERKRRFQNTGYKTRLDTKTMPRKRKEIVKEIKKQRNKKK